MDTALTAGMWVLDSFLTLWQTSNIDPSPSLGIRGKGVSQVIFRYAESELLFQAQDIYHLVNLGALRKSPKGEMLSSPVSFAARMWTHCGTWPIWCTCFRWNQKLLAPANGAGENPFWRMFQGNRNIQAHGSIQGPGLKVRAA